MLSDLKVFIGWDSREPLAAAVLMHSILTRASAPVALYPLTRASVAHAYTRERMPTESTEFSFTRFLVPYLSRYEGWSVFMDCDMLCQVDLWDALLPEIEAQGDKEVLVCPHNYLPKTATKMDGQVQTVYPRKNWSSFMAFNNAKCRTLTRQYVNTATGGALHQFAWVQDAEIGTLPLSFNWLVGEYAPKPEAEILHYTLGGPWMAGYEACDHADLWCRERDSMLGVSAVTGWRKWLGFSA